MGFTTAIQKSIAVETDRLPSLTSSVRADEPDSVHQLRICLRRLRSVLGSFRRVYPATKDLRREMRWLASVLGQARDAEVLSQRFEAEVAFLAEHDMVGPVELRWLKAKLVEPHRHLYLAHWQRSVAAIDSARAREMITALQNLHPKSKHPRGRRVLRRALNREHSKLLRYIELADDEASLDRLHEVRKSAKRLRFAAEVGGDNSGALGTSCTRVAKSAKEIQSLLGDHRDAMLAREVVNAVHSEAIGSGTDTYALGVLDDVLATAERNSWDEYPGAVDAFREDWRDLSRLL